MAIDAFIPEYWSTRLQRHLDRVLIYAQPTVCNRSWEGEISEAGDTVHINKMGNPTIHDYEVGVDLADPEEPDGTTQALTVDQFKAFNVKVDDVNDAQANVNLLDEFAKRAGVGMAQAIDSIVAGKIVAAATINMLGTDAVPVKVQADEKGDLTPYELAVEIERLLAEADVPEGESKWMIVNPAIMKEIRLDDSFIKASEMGAEMVRNGRIGEISGIELLQTTGVPTSPGNTGEDEEGEAVANFKILAGAGNYATTFASQLVKTEAYRPESSFADAVKGLDVFGAKILEPETLVQAHVAK